MLGRYFDAIDKRIERMAGGPVGFDILFDGHRIRMHFASEADKNAALPSFIGATAPGEGIPDAHLTCWRDDIAPYIPEGMGTAEGDAGLSVVKEAGMLHIRPGGTLRGADYRTNRYYLCAIDGGNKPLFGDAHDMLNVLAMWAKQNGYLLLHGAAVGAGGKGVLLSGKGGAGKSTLAVACLLSGLDFVSDDYFFVKTENGVPVSLPLWRNIGLNPDSEARLHPPELPVVRTYPERGNKRFFDVSAWMRTERLPVRALVLPEISDAEHPAIEPCPSGPAITRMVFSTARQLWIMDPKEISRMATVFAGLPAYRMLLCKDVYENARALGAFIAEGVTP
ncbi:MAG: hypothetical protein Q4C53_02705 [Clostridia bacterium]|nr:hypothetical protein [Clostridia bacterium]